MSEARETRGWAAETSFVRRYLGVARFGARAFRLVWTTSRSLTAILGALALVAGVVPAAAAFVGKQIVDGVVAAAGTGADWAVREVLIWVALEAALVVTLAASNRGLATCQSLLRLVLANSITTLVIEKALTLELAQFEDAEIHDRMTQARLEASSRPLSLVMATFTLVRELIALCCYAALLLRFSGWAVLLVFAAGLPAFLIEARFSGAVHRLRQAHTPDLRELNYLERVLTREDFAKEIQVFRLGRRLLAAYRERFESMYQADRRLQLRRGIWGIFFGSVGALVLYSAYLWIILETIAGRLTIGEMTMYLVLFRQAQAAVTASLTAVGTMYEDNLFLSNLYGFLEMPVPAPVGGALEGIAEGDGLRFEDVSFTYPGSRRPAVEGISFHLRPGEQLALVGENGSGKTTLVKLLTRLYEPSGGRILLHGRDLRDWEVGELRRRLAVIFQDFLRFKLTLGANVGAGDVDHFGDRERWLSAVSRALAASVVETAPQGFDTRLGRSFKGGHELSGGQWQRVALARLFMRDEPDVYVLDEPTASVDAEGEEQIFAQVKQAAQGRMVILISHRLSFPRSSDQILVMSKGRIIERGTHRELMEREGRYAELFRLQAAGYRDSVVDFVRETDEVDEPDLDEP